MGNYLKGHQGHARSKKTREQETQYQMKLFLSDGYMNGGVWQGKSRGVLRERLESSGHGGIRFDRSKFIKAEISKRQSNGSFLLVEIITELAP